MAKHWKSFVKKDTAPKKEYEDLDQIASLLSPEAKKSDKSLDDVAEFNSSLKSLIEEQKKLEDQMAELTGKKEKSTTDKKYEHAIKTIDQKKKEEAAAEEKRRKRKESHRKKHDDRWEVTPSFKSARKENDISSPSISNNRKKAKPNTEFIKRPKKETVTPNFTKKKKATNSEIRIPKVQRKPETKIVSKKKKQANSLLEIGKKIQEKKQAVDNFANRSKELKLKAKQLDRLISTKPKSQKKPLLKKINTLQDSLSLEKKTKPVNAAANVLNTTKKTIEVFNTVGKKVSKVNDTFQAIKEKGTDLQTGIDKVANVTASPKLQALSKKVSKGMGIVNKVGKKLDKVDSVFNTANKKLEKVNSVTNLFEKKLKSVDFISKNDRKTNNGFDFDFIQKQQTKKEETLGFNVADKKLNIDLGTIKKIKDDIDTLKDMKKKKKKDNFAL